jgi:predicted MPP superfamily phosphohydrolase
MYHIPGAPNLALLTDLHNADPAPGITSLHSHRPSLICITGDVLYGGRPEGDVSPLETQKNVLPFLSAYAAIATTFMSLGNHEWMVDQEDLRLLSSTGVTVLDNEWRSITVGGKEIVISGLTSGYVTDYRTFRAESGSSDRYPRQESISESEARFMLLCISRRQGGLKSTVPLPAITSCSRTIRSIILSSPIPST